MVGGPVLYLNLHLHFMLKFHFSSYKITPNILIRNKYYILLNMNSSYYKINFSCYKIQLLYSFNQNSPF